MPLRAVQHVRPMRGGAQAHLMRAEDGNFCVVKFQNNPQHRRVLANELLATGLGLEIGLPMAAGAIIEVDEWLIRNTPELNVQLGGRSFPCLPGLQFGSRYVVNPVEEAVQVLDFLPETMLARVRNVEAFAGVLALDKWTCNANGRQAVFWKRPRERRYAVTFIDQGYCFNAGEWSFPDAALRGVYARNNVYADVRGWEAFVPWLGRIETIAPSRIAAIADTVPLEWYGDWDEMERLVQTLIGRRDMVRDLIEQFRNSARNPFPQWQEPSAISSQPSVIGIQ